MTPEGLSSYAVDVLGQLFAFGPTWDGYILSKMGRNELIELGLAFHENAFASLTPEGVRVASEWEFSDRVMLEYPEWKQKLKR